MQIKGRLSCLLSAGEIIPTPSGGRAVGVPADCGLCGIRAEETLRNVLLLVCVCACFQALNLGSRDVPVPLNLYLP